MSAEQCPPDQTKAAGSVTFVPAEKSALLVGEDGAWQQAPPPGPDTVLRGRDDYLFDLRYGSAEQITGRLTVTTAQVAAFAARLAQVRDLCRELAARYYLLVTPEKYVVYPDKLPAGVAVSNQRPIARILAGLPAPLRACVMYPDDSLRSNRSPLDTYDRTDMHWNSFGAFVAYVDLHAALVRDGVPLTPMVTTLERSDYWKVGDLGIRLTPEQVERAIRMAAPASDTTSHTFSQSQYRIGQVDVFQTPSAPPLRAVMFRDSNASLLLPFLARHFARTVTVATDRICDDLLIAEQPDVVITQITERALCQPAPDGSGGLLFPDGLAPVNFTALTSLPLPLPVA